MSQHAHACSCDYTRTHTLVHIRTAWRHWRHNRDGSTVHRRNVISGRTQGLAVIKPCLHSSARKSSPRVYLLRRAHPTFKWEWRSMYAVALQIYLCGNSTSASWSHTSASTSWSHTSASTSAAWTLHHKGRRRSLWVLLLPTSDAVC